MTFADYKFLVPSSVRQRLQLNTDYKLALYMWNNPSTYDLPLDIFREIENSITPDDTVLKFIEQFKTHLQSDEAYEHIERLFRAGYCWHFAHLLQNVFGTGTVCNAYPFSHVMWVDKSGIAYDIEGVYVGEALYFIPEPFFHNSLKEFRHLPTYDYAISKEELMAVGKRYCKHMGYEFNTNAFESFVKSE